MELLGSDSREEELRAAFGYDAEDPGTKKEFLAALTEEEVKTIERSYQENELSDISGGEVLSEAVVTSKTGVELWFDCGIGCGGESYDVRGPYQIRDKGRADLSDCLEETEWFLSGVL